MGAELNRLARHGWRVLHSIPLASQVDVDHLLYQERQVAALAPLAGALTAEQVEQVYSAARHRQAWSQA
ncbi:hypothetical protein [Streptomyces tanashiensis]